MAQIFYNGQSCHDGDRKAFEVMTSIYPIDNLESLATLGKKKKKKAITNKQTNKTKNKTTTTTTTQKAKNMSNADAQLLAKCNLSIFT